MILAPSLLFPFGRDQSVFAYVGRVIADGGMPYRDAWEIKPPGIYVAYAALARLAPDTGWGLVLAVRIADVLIAVATGVVLAMIARRFGRPEAGLAVAAWYAALCFMGGFWSMAQPDVWANLPVVGAALLCLASPGGLHPVRRLGTAGVLVGCAAALKPTAVLPFVPFAVDAVWRRPRDRPATVVALVLGGVLPLAAGTAWLSVGGALADYVGIQRSFVTHYAQLTAAGPASVVSALVDWARLVWLPITLGLCCLCLEVRARRRSIALALSALGAGAAAVVVQGKYFPYHWATAWPWLALLAGIGGVAAASHVLGSAKSMRVALLAAAPAVLFLLATQWETYRDAAWAVTGTLPREQWLQRFRTADRDFSYLADEEVAQYVRANTGPEDGVLIWGFEPAVYLLADRRPSTRFFFSAPVAVKFASGDWQREYLSDLMADPPTLVLVVENDAIPWATGLEKDSAAQLRDWPELDQWIERHYRLERRIEDFAILRRR